ncbi:MAG: four helix bundle protein [candidate division WWE3 bacterium]|nr:four helix bundle protein [candidate division WWE3 bacterium]
MFKTDKSKELYFGTKGRIATERMRGQHERCYRFARDCAGAVKSLGKIAQNQIYSRQLIRSSLSIPANYIEAQEALSRRDFLYRLRICRKESKESIQWIRLIVETNDSGIENFEMLLQESKELMLIFSKAVGTALKWTDEPIKT